MPKRIQRKRTKGWRMPEGAVYVGRTRSDLRWGNPYRIGARCTDPRTDEIVTVRDAAHAVELYRNYLAPWLPTYPDMLDDLRGRDLACWCRLCSRHADGKPASEDCPDCAPCHADVLLELANAPEGKGE